MILEALIAELKATGLADKPGKLLYSGLRTLSPGETYLLGYNPGGDPEFEANSILSHLCRDDAESNEYLDGRWRRRGRLCDAGAAPMQRRVCHMLKGLGWDARSACASNVIFVRSEDIGSLNTPQELARRCWPVHRLILKQVGPKCIIVLGDDAFKFIRDQGRAITEVNTYPAGHGDWKCRHTRILLDERQLEIISVPHLSYYAIDRHADVYAWIRGKLTGS